MTYSEVLHRMIELMFIQSIKPENQPSRWIHSSYADRLRKILYRTKQRFSHSSQIIEDQSDEDELISTKPIDVVKNYETRFPKIETQLMAAEDVDYFLHLAREGGKPVNFIPVIDKGTYLFVMHRCMLIFLQRFGMVVQERFSLVFRIHRSGARSRYSTHLHSSRPRCRSP